MNVLITGANGLLGPYLVETFRSVKHNVSTTTREGCDLTKRASVKALLSGTNPDVVIHAAAETNIDYCEAEPIKALEANRDSTYHLVELLPPQAKLVYISTDMVYPDIRGPHREGDVGPVNMYGRSKLAGEKAAAVNPRHFVARTNFFGQSKTPGRLSFSDWVIESLTERPGEVFFYDVWWSPLHMKTLSQVILEAVEKDVIGIYNVGSRDGMTKAAFAECVAAHKGLAPPKHWGASHYETKRPHDLRMDCSKLEEKGLKMPKLEEEIKKL